MSEAFTRTPAGMVGSRFFYSTPVVWVEGPTDIYFYEPITGGLNCSLKPFYGYSNARALIDGLLDGDYTYPYAIILDGDYSILAPRRSKHRWVIVLKRYSFENYLWERESLNRSCLKHAQCGEMMDVLGKDFSQIETDIETKLRPLVELDIAARRSDPSPDVLPKGIDQLLTHPERPEICPHKSAQLIEKVAPQLNDDVLEKAKKDVDSFLKNRLFTHLLNGHLLFGILQRVFTQVTTGVRGKKVILNNDGICQLLAEMVWRSMPSSDHKLLRRKLVTVIKEIQPPVPTVSP